MFEVDRVKTEQREENCTRRRQECRSPRIIVGVQKPARILLAEDDDEMRQLLARALRNGQHTVIDCCNGLELLECVVAATEHRGQIALDLIISDISMPYVTGLEALKELREARKLTIPIVLITACGSDEMHGLARRLGAAAVIDKPFDLDRLRDTVRTVLSAGTVPNCAMVESETHAGP